MENTASTKTSAIINNITGTFKTMYNHPTGSFATMVFVCFFCSIIIFYVVSSISYDLVDYYVSTKDLHYENLNPLQHVGIVITI